MRKRKNKEPKNQIKISIKETQGDFIIFFQMINIMVKIIIVISIYHLYSSTILSVLFLHIY